MKYLNKLFAFEERQTNQHCFSVTFTSTLYSVTFTPKSNQEELRESTLEVDRREELRIAAHGGGKSDLTIDSSVQSEAKAVSSANDACLLTSPVAKTKADIPTITLAGKRLVNSTTSVFDPTTSAIEEEDDWILLGDTIPSNQRSDYHTKVGLKSPRQLQQMALDQSAVELIRASWDPVLKNKEAAGVLLFKGLFTKFPDYLKLFSFKDDLDLERMKENKRLLSHARKVIDTVTFVVNAVGDDSQTAALDDALLSLVRGHLKKKPPIGLTEFRNLGIVLIDFICDINNRRGPVGATKTSADDHCMLNKSSTGDSINNSSIDSDTMTNALDKVRASTSPSSSEDDSYLEVARDNPAENFSSLADGEKGGASKQDSTEPDRGAETKIDTNILVAAWTKLYSIILDLVKQEEEQANE